MQWFGKHTIVTSRPHHDHQLHSPPLPTRDPTATPPQPPQGCVGSSPRSTVADSRAGGTSSHLTSSRRSPEQVERIRKEERERISPFSSLASWSSAGKRKKKMRKKRKLPRASSFARSAWREARVGVRLWWARLRSRSSLSGARVFLPVCGSICAGCARWGADTALCSGFAPDVSVIFSDKFQQSQRFELKVPQIQFFL